MKRKISILVAIFMLSLVTFAFMGCSVSATSLSLEEPNSTIMNLGMPVGVYDSPSYMQLTATVEPAGAKLHWESNNIAVAIVGQNGVVKAIGAGTARIYVRSGSLEAYVDIVVRAPQPTGFIITPGSSATEQIPIAEGFNRELQAIVSPHTSPMAPYIPRGALWEIVEGASYISLSQAGIVGGIARGTAIVRATSEALDANGNPFVAYAFIEVFPVATSLTVSTDELTLWAGDEYRVHARPNRGHLLPTDARWTSSNSNVVSVTEDGVISIAHGVTGSAIVTATVSIGGVNMSESISVSVATGAKPQGAISTPSDWRALGGTSATSEMLGQDWHLVNDIDFGDRPILPIGASSSGALTSGYAFRGTMDGRGRVIKHFSLAAGATVSGGTWGSSFSHWGASGVFAGTSSTAVIRNLVIIEGANGPHNVVHGGLLVQNNRGLIENVFIQGTLLNNPYPTANPTPAAWNASGPFFAANSGRIENSVVMVRAAPGAVNMNRIGGTSTGGGASNVFIVLDYSNANTANSGGTFSVTNVIAFNMANITTVNFTLLPNEFWQGNQLGTSELPRLLRL
ncbi:MAG: Ig-like domain-containing protein [Firmicutes bacterium]|nr:Ig-like domain-containing protein [Bacillota bacterium]